MANDKSAKPANATNKAPNAPNADTGEFAGWSEEQTGFAPYWQAVEGAAFTGIPTDVDDTGKFTRVIFTATRDTQCFTGPADSQEPVTVKKGEQFTLSIYDGLRKLFSEYFNAGFPVEVRVTALEKIETSNGNDFWRFRVQVEPGCKERLDASRMQRNAEKLRNISVRGALPAVKSA